MEVGMRINWKTMTALAGTLALSATVANAAPVLNLKPSSNAVSNIVELAREGGGGGGGGGGEMRGGGEGGGGGGGGAAMRGEGGGGGGGAADNGRMRGSDHTANEGGDRDRRGSNFDRDHMNDRRHSANRDHDHDHDGNFNRHRVFRNGAWVWVYGPDTYAYGDDCRWMLRRAQATGNPYWWDRYNACIY
jgi:hypothetical protein